MSLASTSSLTHRFEWNVSLTRHLLVSVNDEVSLRLMSSSLSASLLSKISSAYQEIMAEFLEIVGLGFSPGHVKHDVRHHVEARCLPISMLAWRLPGSPEVCHLEGRVREDGGGGDISAEQFTLVLNPLYGAEAEWILVAMW